jgi:hypothetical protein
MICGCRMPAAAKTGRAMELPSPVASLVPESRAQCSGDVGDRLYWSATIPIKRVPVLRDPGRRLPAARRQRMARKKAKRQTGSNNAVLPVMRPDAAGME